MHAFHPLPVVAKWERVLKLYGLDKPEQFRRMYKLTDIHLNPTAQSAIRRMWLRG
jgi:hypothetical protein